MSVEQGVDSPPLPGDVRRESGFALCDRWASPERPGRTGPAERVDGTSAPPGGGHVKTHPCAFRDHLLFVINHEVPCPLPNSPVTLVSKILIFNYKTDISVGMDI